MLIASLVVPVIGIALPLSPFGHALGFRHLPFEYYPILGGMVLVYLALVEQAKAVFYRRRPIGAPIAIRRTRHERRVQRRAARFSHGDRLRSE